jgi:hypothetical protein
MGKTETKIASKIKIESKNNITTNKTLENT